MHRFLVDAQVLKSDSPDLSADARRHLKVLRLKRGEHVELFDGLGTSREYELAGEGCFAAVSPSVFLPRPARGLALFACVTKGSRWDWTIEKATELGVARIVPVISDRTIVRIAQGERAAKRERWQRIAEDAARQSDAKWLPQIDEAVDFRGALEIVRSYRCFVGALTEPPSPPLAEAVRSELAKGSACSLAVFVGPEGDFTHEELAALVEIALPTSFGPTVLRAETAAIFALSVVQSLKDGVSR